MYHLIGVGVEVPYLLDRDDRSSSYFLHLILREIVIFYNECVFEWSVKGCNIRRLRGDYCCPRLFGTNITNITYHHAVLCSSMQVGTLPQVRCRLECAAHPLNCVREIQRLYSSGILINLSQSGLIYYFYWRRLLLKVSHSANCRIPSITYKLKVHKSPKIDPTQSHINLVHT